MARVLTNNSTLQYAVEQSLGVLPGSPSWYLLEPNSINTYGATITTVARSPISKNRQERKGTITDLDSSVEFEADLTFSHFIDFIEGFLFANFQGTTPFVPTAVTATGYTVASGGALTQDTLIYARGFNTSANNGLKAVGAGSTATEIKTSGLTAEASPPTNVEVAIAGVRGATGDIQIDSNGDIISTTLDFTTLGLTVGQSIHVGGADTVTQFATAANTGYVRLTAIATNKLTIDKRGSTFVTDTGTGKTIDLLFGRFLKNVATDDVDYVEKSFQFELTYTNLDNPSGDKYEYAEGNYCNQVSFNIPITDKATATFGFIGTDTPEPTTTRATNASTAISPNRTTALNTSADMPRLRIQQLDETGITTDFKSLTMTLNNNASPEKVLANLGAKYINTGNFQVSLEAQLLFTDSAVASAVRNNTTVMMDFVLKNDDGGILVDIPAMTLGGGAREFPVNETVLINTTGNAFADPTLNTSIGISLFPYLP